MDNRASIDGSASRSVLLIGPGELPDAMQRALQAAAARVTCLPHPGDADIRKTLSEQVDSVIVFSRDDAVALRLAGGSAQKPRGGRRRSLFSIGVVRDVYRIGGTLLAAAALGSDATEAFLHEQTVYLVTSDGRIEPFEADVQALPTASAARPDRES